MKNMNNHQKDRQDTGHSMQVKAKPACHL